MSKRQERTLAAVVVILATLLWMSCGGDSPTAPVVVQPTPGPSASPSPSVDRCEPRQCRIQGPDYIQGIGPLQPHQLDLLVLDVYGSPIDNKCEYDRRVRWDFDGPIQRIGDRDGHAFRFFPLAAGVASVYAELGDRANCRFTLTVRE